MPGCTEDGDVLSLVATENSLRSNGVVAAEAI